MRELISAQMLIACLQKLARKDFSLMRNALAVCVFSFLAVTAVSSQSLKAPRLRIIAEIPVAQNVSPRWCYTQEPGIVFLSGATLMRGTTRGETQKIEELDGLPDPSSLSCSENAQTIVFLSAQHDRLFVYERSRLSIYSLKSASPPKNFRFGSLLSADGETLAVPGDLKILFGPDVLVKKRILNVRTNDVFWSEKYVFVRSSNQTVSVLDAQTLQEKNVANLEPKRLLNGIYDCGDEKYYMAFSDDADRSYFSLIDPITLGELASVDNPIKTAELGQVSSFRGGCWVSVTAKNNVSISVVQHLVLLRGLDPRPIDVEQFQFLNSTFISTNDLKYLVSYQSRLRDPAQRSPIVGNVVILALEEPAR